MNGEDAHAVLCAGSRKVSIVIHCGLALNFWKPALLAGWQTRCWGLRREQFMDQVFGWFGQWTTNKHEAGRESFGHEKRSVTRTRMNMMSTYIVAETDRYTVPLLLEIGRGRKDNGVNAFVPPKSCGKK